MDRINARQLAELPSPGVRFFAQDAGTGEVLAAACPARRELELKVGAQVGRVVGVVCEWVMVWVGGGPVVVGESWSLQWGRRWAGRWCVCVGEACLCP